MNSKVVARTADLSALRSLLAPGSVAVVGAGRRHGGLGHETLHSLHEYGFRGHLFAVNQSGRPSCGVPAYRSVADLPEPPDLLIIAVPVEHALHALAVAGQRGTRAAVLLESGWAEGDPTITRRRETILRVARDHRIRLLGPGSLGVLNADPQVRLNASLAPVRPPAGGLAVAVRSGGLGIALLQAASLDRCGISTFVSVGDETDVTTGQLVAYWYDDPATRGVIMAHDPAGGDDGFAVLNLARRKPVIAISGTRPSSSRDDLAINGGVIHTAGVGDALDTARMLVDQPAPAGNRVVVVGNAGDLIALTSRTAQAWGFDVRPLSGSTRAQLPHAAGSRRSDNPVDLGLGAPPERIAAAVETIAHTDEADILLLVLAGTRATVLAAATSTLARVLDDHPGLTAAAVLTGSTDEVRQLGDRRVPVFRDPEQAVRSLARSLNYAQWRRRPPHRRATAASLIADSVRWGTGGTDGPGAVPGAQNVTGIRSRSTCAAPQKHTTIDAVSAAPSKAARPTGK